MSARGTARAWAASSHGHPWLIDIGSVHPAYNSSFSACFLAGTVFFSHNKSVNSVFQSVYQHSRTGPYVGQNGGGGGKWKWAPPMHKQQLMITGVSIEK
jgi:hypothetical protein